MQGLSEMDLANYLWVQPLAQKVGPHQLDVLALLPLLALQKQAVNQLGLQLALGSLMQLGKWMDWKPLALLKLLAHMAL